MARIQPVLSPSEVALVERVALITRAKKSDVVRNALAVYYWHVRQAVTGARILVRKPSGEELTIETPELSALEGEARKLSPRELAVLARELARATDAAEAARLRERLARGFYGI